MPLVPPTAVPLVPPTAGLHYTPVRTDIPPSSGVIPSNYSLSTPLATSQVGETWNTAGTWPSLCSRPCYSQGHTAVGVYPVGPQARPVQRVPPKEALPEGFGFISKQNRGDAFDFVQAEMTRAKEK